MQNTYFLLMDFFFFVGRGELRPSLFLAVFLKFTLVSSKIMRGKEIWTQHKISILKVQQIQCFRIMCVTKVTKLQQL